MKITPKLLHLPPHLTTTWNHVKALYMKELALIVVLDDDKQVAIENLPKETLDQVFAVYSTYLESPPPQLPSTQAQNPQFMLNAGPAAAAGGLRPIGRFNFDALDPSGMAMQHNPEQADTPEFPEEVLSKIAAIAKIVAPEDTAIFPKPEPHCNCPHCQIARAINQGADLIPHAEQHVVIEHKLPEEEIVSPTDLQFPDWNIEQIGQNLYDVTSRLDANDKYRVFLGEPVGCNCGKPGCEHILAVLKS